MKHKDALNDLTRKNISNNNEHVPSAATEFFQNAESNMVTEKEIEKINEFTNQLFQSSVMSLMMQRIS